MKRYNTKQRQMLSEFLKANPDKSFSADQIAEKFSGLISLSAVYRNLSALEKAGVIGVSAKSDTKKKYYRYLADDKCRDHLHISCVSCGKTFHIDEKTTQNIINSVKENSEFFIDSSQTVFYGKCKNCSSKGR